MGPVTMVVVVGVVVVVVVVVGVHLIIKFCCLHNAYVHSL